MVNNLLSVIIPSRTEQYLQKTVDDILNKAKGDVEVIVVLDGYWPTEYNWSDLRIRIIHQGKFENNFGMRAAINAGFAIARGEYIMKIDEHCMLDEGFDEKLKADCEYNWIVIPRRYRLDPDNWILIEDGRKPIDYMYLTNPFERPDDKSNGLRGAEWKERSDERKDILVDETMSWQGSCYFAHRKYWNELFPNGLDDNNYGPFTGEAQEIGNTVWLNGGKLIVNKKTWYAHFWKGKRGKNYGFTNKQYEDHSAGIEKGRKYAVNHWLSTKDYKYDFNWLMERFWPIPTWPENWQEYIIKELEKYPK